MKCAVGVVCVCAFMCLSVAGCPCVCCVSVLFSLFVVCLSMHVFVVCLSMHVFVVCMFMCLFVACLSMCLLCVFPCVYL